MIPVIETRSSSRISRLTLSLIGGAILGIFILPSLVGAMPPGTSFWQKKQSPAKAARAAMTAAGKLARTPKGASKKEKLAAKARAVEAYADLETRYATHAGIVAEARFRKGQILGRMGQEEQALRAYRGALSADANKIGARAMLEAGHLERRLKRYSEALGFYRESAALGQPAKAGSARSGKGKGKATVGATPSSYNRRYGSQARLWTGVVLSRLGRVPDARKCWASLAALAGLDARLRIKAFDRLAMSYLGDKREDEARKILADADESLAAACEGKTKKAQSLRRSLDRMRSRKALAKAEAARQEKHGEQGIR